MSQEGDGHASAPSAPPGVPGVMTFGAPAVGDMITDRYSLDEHVDTDAAGRQIWRGMDVVLRRPVAVVIRQPGGEPAAGMMSAAHAGSRIVHPHLVSVYDAIDDGYRAYLVREWVSGVALRDVLKQAPLDAERATLVTHAVAEAVSALHAAGIVHGNVHPGTILIADDGRVVVTDAHADGPAETESDVRAIGAVLYASLTGHWPHAEAGYSSLPDAVRDNNGRLATPRQARAGIPSHLDEIAADLLDPELTPPTASSLAAEFARLAVEGAAENDEYDDYDAGPMGFGSNDAGGRRRVGGKLALGVAVLVVIAIVGAIVGAKVLGGSSSNNSGASPDPVNSVTPAASTGKPIAIKADQIRVVDPPGGNRSEVAGIEKVVDDNTATGWSTDLYNRSNFGGLKPGMGILINLGAPTKVGAVRVVVSQQGATMSLRSGTADPGNTSDGDKTISTAFTPLGQDSPDSAGTVVVFAVPAAQQEQQFLLLWITKLPLDTVKNKYTISVNEITVLAA